MPQYEAPKPQNPNSMNNVYAEPQPSAPPKPMCFADVLQTQQKPQSRPQQNNGRSIVVNHNNHNMATAPTAQVRILASKLT